jgi:hypothetical protein
MKCSNAFAGTDFGTDSAQGLFRGSAKRSAAVRRFGLVDESHDRFCRAWITARLVQPAERFSRQRGTVRGKAGQVDPGLWTAELEPDGEPPAGAR